MDHDHDNLHADKHEKEVVAPEKAAARENEVEASTGVIGASSIAQFSAATLLLSVILSAMF